MSAEFSQFFSEQVYLFYSISHPHRISLKCSSMIAKQSTSHAPARLSNTYEGTSKNPLTAETGAADLPLSSSSLTSLVATEVARHNAEFESKLRAETEATIAREVKAKVAEILNARPAAEQFTEDEAPTAETVKHEGTEGKPESLAAGQAQKEEPRPKIGTPWQIMLALGALICPTLIVGGAVMDTLAISMSGLAFTPLSLSCFLLLLLCDPSNRDGEKYLIPLYVLSFVSSVGTVMYVNLVQLKFSTFASITVPLTLLLCLFGMLFFFILARRKIGDFTRQDLKDFVYKIVFWNGLGSLTPIIYLTAESLKCFLEHFGESDLDVLDTCRGMYFPQLSICCMFVLFLAARLFFIPLSPYSFDSDAIVRFEDIDLKLKFQAVLFSYVALSNLALFALMEKGPLTFLIRVLHYSELGCVVLIMLVEFVSTLVLNAGRRRRESQAAKADSIVSSFSDNIGTLEIV